MELRNSGAMRLPDLSVLERALTWCKGMSVVCVWWLASLVHLKIMHLKERPSITDGGMRRLLAVPLLAKLDLNMRTKVTDEGVALIACLTCLADLDLGVCPKIAGEWRE
ncbi:unnamed protein product [Ostreobium quekettii]|uniref:Uncharacterized protein n=1 Tax=Ostreobium quekettii TaxID=121088 RepID=A0A8S1JDN6_9CHLO|nr:unnamed protein product [Ostreobium quekettii]